MCFVLRLWQTKCTILYFLLKDEPLQRLPAANSVLKRTMPTSKNALKVGNRKLLEIPKASQVVNNSDDVNHSELTNLHLILWLKMLTSANILTFQYDLLLLFKIKTHYPFFMLI